MSSLHHFCTRCEEDFDYEDELEMHFEQDHHYCCSQFFDSERQLRAHKNDHHWYCESCNRTFRSESNLDSHLRSSVHLPRRFKCPGCNNAFISPAALILHCEAGRCPSGVTRQAIDRLVVAFDRNNIITNPNRLLQGPDGSYSAPSTITSWATRNSFNGQAYECVLCHREFRTLDALNSHLRSPAHADKIYRCPGNGCGTQFRALSALVQHVESGSCGVKKFRNQIDQMVGSVASLVSGMRSLTF
ncbi:hypothetical protein EUX98_g1976 [Antrodiella citrinella]|uniref:C2H2-type domain-containing protein n=1 Tax=Antrodiella citrinella TaxID=2447956 RepID=A0A4S4N318_9APHY|nr:hypothetical protein EUX98_g1976 [Antrodiella citrinella]